MTRVESATHEREIIERVTLATDAGTLRPEAIGYSRVPLHDAAITGRWGRRKRWEYWCVITSAGALQITIADLDYVGLVELSFVDFVTQQVASAPLVVPLALRFRLPDRCGEPVSIRSPLASVSITPGEPETRIVVHARTPRGRLDAEVVIATPRTEESLSVVVPWSDTEFQLTTKRVALPARGEIAALGRRYPIDAAHEGFACLDFGRGVWPRDTIWNWGTGAIDRGGSRVGLQLGGKWTDGTGATENGVFLDGRLDKLGGELQWTYAREDFMRPWRVRGRDVELAFTPALERTARLNLRALRTELHLCFGRWSGHVHAHGRDLAIDGALGWAEEHRAHW